MKLLCNHFKRICEFVYSGFVQTCDELVIGCVKHFPLRMVIVRQLMWMQYVNSCRGHPELNRDLLCWGGRKNGMIAKKHRSIRNPFTLDVVVFYFCFCNKKGSDGNATTISRKKFIENCTKVYSDTFLMNFQTLEFQDDIQPIFVSVLAG